MEKREKWNGKQKVLVMLAAVLVLLCTGGTARARTADGTQERSTHVLTCYDTRYNDGLLMVGYFEIDGGITAMCVCHELDPPSQTGTVLTTIASYTAENQGNELLRKIYYYGWKGPGDIGATYVETSLAGSVANGHDDNYYKYGQQFIDRIAGLPAAPKGFDVYLLSDGVSSTQNLAYWDYHPTGYAALEKAGADMGFAGENLCYSLEGAEYGIYTEENCQNEAAVLTTNAEGKTNTVELEPGNYYVREKKAPAGYRMDSKVYPVTVTAQETQTVQVEDVPVWDSIGLSLYKQDAETGEGTPLGAAALEGARFQVCFYAGYYTLDNLPENPERMWTLETKAEEVDGEIRYLCRLDDEYLVEGDEFYKIEEQTVLPLGTITIEESRAPEGYLLAGVYYEDGTGKRLDGKYLTQIRQNGDEAEVSGGNWCAASDYVIRGDLKLVKIADGTHERLAGIPFQITSHTTGESHVIVTDENGQASTASKWNLHSSNTNQGETALDGVWFGTGSDADDGKGALPFDTYTIEELRCENNQNYDLIPPFTVTIKKDQTVVNLGTMTNDQPEEEEPEEPDKPEEPEQPEESEQPESPSENRKAATVKTGDDRNAGILLITCILSCVAVVTCVMIARRMKKR